MLGNVVGFSYSEYLGCTW